jgi:hypothetical protein
VIGGSAAVLLGAPQDNGLIAAQLNAVAITQASRSGFARHEVGAP